MPEKEFFMEEQLTADCVLKTPLLYPSFIFSAVELLLFCKIMALVNFSLLSKI